MLFDSMLELERNEEEEKVGKSKTFYVIAAKWRPFSRKSIPGKRFVRNLCARDSWNVCIFDTFGREACWQDEVSIDELVLTCVAAAAKRVVKVGNLT